MTKLREIEGFPENRNQTHFVNNNGGNGCYKNIGNLDLDGDVERLAGIMFEQHQQELYGVGEGLTWEIAKEMDKNRGSIVSPIDIWLIKAEAIIKDLSWLRIKGEK